MNEPFALILSVHVLTVVRRKAVCGHSVTVVPDSYVSRLNVDVVFRDFQQLGFSSHLAR